MMRSVALALAALLATVPAAASVEREWRFRVLLDEREIGWHEFRVVERGAEREVESRARFDVKLLFVNAYRYLHESRERWRDDCLREIVARTDDNGRMLSVRGTPLRARRYTLHATAYRIDVWYAGDADWVQLESRTANGRVLRYVAR